jgi:hypothetical protein
MGAIVTGGRGRGATVVLLAAVVLSAVAMGTRAQAAHGSLRGPEVGTVADITWGIPRADVDRTVSALADAGVRWVRANVSWSGGEPDAKGVVNQGYLADVDYAVSRARAAGIQVLMPIADGVPYWASADPGRHQDGSGRYWNKYWRPGNFADYADFVRVMVQRYAPQGVHAFELWNEPNTSRFWPSGPNPTEYRALLAAAYPAVKEVDPTATVLLGGLSKNDYDYLQRLYGTGARPYFDAVAVHPYTGSVDPDWCWDQAGTTKRAVDAFCGIEEVRRTMEANGDAAKQLWLTELGWSTTTSAYGVSEATQADYLTKAFTRLQNYPYVQVAFWYNFRNTWWLADTPGDYEANHGLLRTDFSPKPALAALRTYTGGSPVPGPDTQAPKMAAIAVTDVTGTSAAVVWTTDEGADSRVEVWSGSEPPTVVADTALVSGHRLALSDLVRRTKYSYRVRSTDAAGNASMSGVLSFTTRNR